MPKVSVLLPVYNTNPEHLHAAIDSILAQTFTDFELLILDDCSTSPGVREAATARADSRIRFIENEKNLGISGSRNRLIDMAQGSYLAVADHDDISLPGRLEQQAAFLDHNPEVGVVGAMLVKMPRNRQVYLPPDNEAIENLLMFKSAVEHPVAMIRKNVLNDLGLRYEEEFSPAEDYRLWTRLLGKTKFANLPEVLLHYRSHKANTTHTIPEKMNQRVGLAALLARIAHPGIWVRAQRSIAFKTTYKLFGAIPVLTAIERHNRKKYLLFNVLPLGTSKRRLHQ